LVTDREIALVAALYVMLIMMVGAHNNFLDALDKHISAPQKESERQQELDLQEVYRRRQLVVKNEHKLEINQLQGLLHAANAKFDRLNFEYEWISNAYQDKPLRSRASRSPRHLRRSSSPIRLVELSLLVHLAHSRK
jgi:hypothetical protein